MKDLLIYTWKTILCGSSAGLSAELCVYIAFKGLDLPAPAVSLQTPNSLKPVRAGDFSGPVYRMPIQLVSSIHLMGREEQKKAVTPVGENSSSHFFSGVGTNKLVYLHFPFCHLFCGACTGRAPGSSFVLITLSAALNQFPIRKLPSAQPQRRDLEDATRLSLTGAPGSFRQWKIQQWLMFLCDCP